MMWSILDITQTKNSNLSANPSDRGKKQNSSYRRTIPVLTQNIHDGQKKRNWLKPWLIFVYTMYNKNKDKYKYAFVLAYFHWFYGEFNGETTLIANVMTNKIIM